MKIVFLAAAIALLLPLGASGKASAPACRGGDLKGKFGVIPGSAGAGNIVYRLHVVNYSSRACTVSGIPDLRLVDRHHHALPTHLTPASKSTLTPLVRLRPGGAAAATARFSPDVPGPGEGGRRQCEPTAWAIRYIPPGHRTLLAPIQPPTPVCEHGNLQVTVMKAS